ncbi:gp53-like domain-containing protein, partial [Citrobacter freundii]|uniref:gp53-like domain-containing protein n=1 Tax=Citrobacter freundii TaxID=546 RepID=UPI000A6E13B2
PSPVTSETELFFTEGGNGVPPTYPGPDWFNAIQSELLNIIRTAGLDPDKMDNTQILVALKKLFLSRSNPFGDIKADGPAAIATALSNLQLGEAAKRDVGTGAGQIPDMSSFQSGGGWFKLPSGYVIQAFEASFDSNGLYINFPIPFPSSVIAIVPGVLMSTPASPSQQFPSIQRDINDLTRFFAKYNIGGMNSSYFIAIGK